ncbi:MAG: DASH family cryptochrome [Cyanobacteria bacterium]|nr:DASH family cryptochrome [Cyanobacteriota bacterium]
MAILLWFRNDLRLHDHEPLRQAVRSGEPVVPVYCFDPRQFGQTGFGFPKTGAFRAQFLRESVADLRANLRHLGSDLILRQGYPEVILPEVARQVKASHCYWHQEVTSEEIAVEQAVTLALKVLDCSSQGFWGTTLYHQADLPFKLVQVPPVFTQFRKQVERYSNINPALVAPQTLPPFPADLTPGEIPPLTTLGLTPIERDHRAVMAFKGGETAALDRLDAYIWQRDRLRHYKETRNGLLGEDYSSKFSPWLALGCLSPRRVYEAVQAYEAKRIKNDSTYWLVFELIWRDYFRFICCQQGDRIFRASGIQGIPIPWKQDWQRFERWRAGQTGYPFVDANMRELAATGFMSNRGRQNVASFLTKNLGIDWRMGAEWFESQLIDYDVCSNWGNWNYTAGVGNDARGFRYFNIPKQAQDYDPEGTYVKWWLPELAQVPAAKVHLPGQLQPVEQKRFQVQLGVDYPQPLVDLKGSAKANQALYDQAINRRRRT